MTHLRNEKGEESLEPADRPEMLTVKRLTIYKRQSKNQRPFMSQWIRSSMNRDYQPSAFLCIRPGVKIKGPTANIHKYPSTTNDQRPTRISLTAHCGIEEFKNRIGAHVEYQMQSITAEQIIHTHYSVRDLFQRIGIDIYTCTYPTEMCRSHVYHMSTCMVQCVVDLATA